MSANLGKLQSLFIQDIFTLFCHRFGSQGRGVLRSVCRELHTRVNTFEDQNFWQLTPAEQFEILCRIASAPSKTTSRDTFLKVASMTYATPENCALALSMLGAIMPLTLPQRLTRFRCLSTMNPALMRSQTALMVSQLQSAPQNWRSSPCLV